MEGDAGKRGEVLTGIQRMLDRVKAATSVLHKSVSRHKEKSTSPHREDLTRIDPPYRILALHQAFISWLIGFFRAQLYPEAAYQRHITALRALCILARSGLDVGIAPAYLTKQARRDTSWCFHTPVFDPWMSRALYDLIMNPFEDVRRHAESLTVIMPKALHNTVVDQKSTISSSEQVSTTLNFLLKAEGQMLRSGRADHADGVSRTYAMLFDEAPIDRPNPHINGQEVWWTSQSDIAYHLVDRLEIALDTAKANPQLAVTRFPMHGILASLRYVCALVPKR